MYEVGRVVGCPGVGGVGPWLEGLCVEGRGGGVPEGQVARSGLSQSRLGLACLVLPRAGAHGLLLLL